MAFTNTKTTNDNANLIEENLDFILEHLSAPSFPRTIMTRALGYQKEVFSKDEALTYFKACNYKDCRINAYPAYTDYSGINLTAPSFMMIDLDLKDSRYSQDDLDRILRKTLDKLDDIFYGAHPTILWTGNGYHIYQPIQGFVLEEIDRFACFIDPLKKDLTSRFMQFAENFITDRKCDPQHRPSIKSCLIRIPGTINSKCDQDVKIVQKWNGIKAPINYLLRDFRTWLVAEKINEQLQTKRSRSYRNTYNNGYYTKTDTIQWIEKLLQIPIADHRKYAVWRILIPYLFNVKKLSEDETVSIVQTWLNRCNGLRSLDFNGSRLIKQNICSSKNRRYLPISYNKLSSENNELCNAITGGW